MDANGPDSAVDRTGRGHERRALMSESETSTDTLQPKGAHQRAAAEAAVAAAAAATAGEVEAAENGASAAEGATTPTAPRTGRARTDGQAAAGAAALGATPAAGTPLRSDARRETPSVRGGDASPVVPSSPQPVHPAGPFQSDWEDRHRAPAAGRDRLDAGGDGDDASLAESSKSSEPSFVQPEVPQALVVVLSLALFDQHESVHNTPHPSAPPSQTQVNRHLEQFDTARAAADGLPSRPKHVWIDVASVAPEDVKLLGTHLGLHPETLERIVQPAAQDTMVLFDNYLELGVNLEMRTEDDAETRIHDVATFIVMIDTLVSFHSPKCATVRELMAQNRLVPVPTDDTGLSSASVATLGPNASQLVLEQAGGPRPLPHLKPDQLFCEVLYAFVHICAVAMQNRDDAIEELHELMLVLEENERSDFLRRMSTNRATLIVMRRHLAVKRALLRNLLVGRPTLFVTPDAAAYLRYIFEQIDYYSRSIGMTKDSLNQVQANYLAKINVEMADVAQRTNDTVKVFTIVATVSLPINMVSGILGMNVYYPNRVEENDTIGPFITSLAVMVGLMALMALVMWRLGLFNVATV